MTSALQLLYIWRSPARRSQEHVAALDVDRPVPDPVLRGCRRDIRQCRRGADCEHSRQPHECSPKTQHSRNCGSHREREFGRSSRKNSDGYLHGNSSNGGVSISTLTRLGLTTNGQLPVAVEQARKRLLERLSVLLTESRQRNLDAGVLYSESAVDDSFIVNHANLNCEVDCWDSFCTLKEETFRSPKEKHEDGTVEVQTECCICLEGYKEEDRLVKLCCSHRFHPSCLEPWVRSSGDCPLCRADIN